jgi:hypothetical protein
LRVGAVLTAAGFLVALIGRVATAGVVGANIGGGLAFLFGGSIVCGMLVWSLFDIGAIRREGARK